MSEEKCISTKFIRDIRTEISLKRKARTILLPGKLYRKLVKYARKIASGEIFLTRSGKGLSRQPDLGGDESPLLRQGGGGAEQGASPQPTASVRQDLLPGLPGCGETGGHPGALQHRNHQDIPHFNGGRTRQAAGLAGAGIVATIKN